MHQGQTQVVQVWVDFVSLLTLDQHLGQGNSDQRPSLMSPCALPAAAVIL